MSWFKSWTKLPVIESDEFSKLIAKLHEIDITNVNAVFSSDMSILMLATPWKSIKNYNMHLSVYTEALKADKPIPRTSIASESYKIYLRDFYIDDRGLYVLTHEMTFEFIRLSEEFFLQYRELTKKEDKSSTQSYNSRVLSKVSSDLSEVITVFHTHFKKKGISIHPKTHR
jgi:hypothetical protein